VDLPEGLESLFIILLAAGLAPIIVALLPGPKIPEVVVLLGLGVIVGPEVLDLAQSEEAIVLIANVGLGLLFFFAGFELDLSSLRGGEGRRAGLAWAVSIVVALIVVGALDLTGVIDAFLPVAIALTTTGLGVLLPILRDSGISATPVGRAVFANGAVGEFLPIVAIAVFLTARGAWLSLALLGAFGAVAGMTAWAMHHSRERHIARLLSRGAETTSQTTVRATVLLVVGLLLLSAELGLDAVLGAFAAGVVLRVVLPDGEPILQTKLDGLAFGFFIPVFFIDSGIRLDVVSIAEMPALLLGFFALMVVVRGVPVALLHRPVLGAGDATRTALYSATTLPLLLAITEVAVSTGEMRTESAAALVGAGVLSVLVLPVLARRVGGAPPPPPPRVVTAPPRADK
jgi:Kef-type K+ transport system membrane component KefB